VAQYGQLPATPTCLTPGGGWHFYFEWPGWNPKESLGQWLDIRGEGRQVLAPPSTHPNGGTYVWEESGRPSLVPVSPAPGWMLDLLQPAAAAQVSGQLDERYAQVYLAAGWHLDSIDAAGRAHWVRPGKNPRDGASATVYSDHSTVWSTSVAGVETHRPYLPNELAHALSVELPWTGPLDQPQRLSVVSAASIRMRRTTWLWQNRVPLGGAAILAGQEGLGKSTVAINLAAGVTVGTVEGDLSEPASVVYVSAEDSEAATLVPRLAAARADLSRVHFVRIDGAEGGLAIPRDLPELKAAMRRHGARLLVLDPLSVHVGDDRTDSHKERDVRRALAPLAAAMDDIGAAALGVMHWNKAPTTTALDRVLGSRAFTAAARAVRGVGEDPDDPDARLLVLVKSNLGPAGTPALAFRIASCFVPDPDGGLPLSTSAVEWMGEREGVRSSDLFKVAEEVEDAGALDVAREFVRDALSDGPLPTKEFEDGRKVAGLSVRTVQRARRAEGVIAEPRRDAEGKRIAGWRLRLPDDESLHRQALPNDRGLEDESLHRQPQDADEGWRTRHSASDVGGYETGSINTANNIGGGVAPEAPESGDDVSSQPTLGGLDQFGGTS